MKKKVKINYLAKDIDKSAKSEFEHSRMIAQSVEGKSTKRYHNSIFLLVQLSRCARLLIDYLTEEMDDQNIITNNHALKRGFNRLMVRTGQKGYGPVTVNKAFAELTKLSLLRNVPRRKGMYQVAPDYFCNGSEKAREHLIREYLERPNAALAARSRREYYENKDKD